MTSSLYYFWVFKFNIKCFTNFFENHQSYTEETCIAIYVLFYNDNSKKYLEFMENRGAMVIIPSGLEIFRSR